MKHGRGPQVCTQTYTTQGAATFGTSRDEGSRQAIGGGYGGKPPGLTKGYTSVYS